MCVCVYTYICIYLYPSLSIHDSSLYFKIILWLFQYSLYAYWVILNVLSTLWSFHCGMLYPATEAGIGEALNRHLNCCIVLSCVVSRYDRVKRQRSPLWSGPWLVWWERKQSPTFLFLHAYPRSLPRPMGCQHPAWLTVKDEKPHWTGLARTQDGVSGSCSRLKHF